MIEKLGLRPIEGEGAVFETAAGIAMESAIYRATIRVNGREASCLLSPSEKDRLDEDEVEMIKFEFDANNKQLHFQVWKTQSAD